GAEAAQLVLAGEGGQVPEGDAVLGVARHGGQRLAGRRGREQVGLPPAVPEGDRFIVRSPPARGGQDTGAQGRRQHDLDTQRSHAWVPPRATGSFGRWSYTESR